MEAVCRKCAATCTRCLPKQLGILAQGLGAQLASLSQEKQLLQNMQICGMVRHTLCLWYGCALW